MEFMNYIPLLSGSFLGFFLGVLITTILLFKLQAKISSTNFEEYKNSLSVDDFTATPAPWSSTGRLNDARIKLNCINCPLNKGYCKKFYGYTWNNPTDKSLIYLDSEEFWKHPSTADHPTIQLGCDEKLKKYFSEPYEIDGGT